MTFDEYQKQSRETAAYPPIGAQFIYPTLGLSGEVGELVNKIKKIFRDDAGEVSEAKRKEVSAELGDALWYIAQIATDFDIKLESIADENLTKLRSRKERNMITGSGDER